MSTVKAVPDSLVLAAVERAERHSRSDTPGVAVGAIKRHLDVAPRSRRVPAKLRALEASGALVRSTRHGVVMWALTPSGKRALQRGRRDGTLQALPESPQHRYWRDARTTAAQEVERFERSMLDGLEDGARLLRADPPASSDGWFALGDRLQRACRRMGSVRYCLHEWAEPDDAHPDNDERDDPSDAKLDHLERNRRRARRMGRRNIRHWSDPATTAEVG
jgi:hypothetical protein